MKIFLSLIFIIILTRPCFALNTLSGWEGMNLSVLNDDLRRISGTTGLQSINTVNDLKSETSITVLNDDLSLISRQLSIERVDAITGFNDINLTVINNDLQYIGQTLGE